MEQQTQSLFKDDFIPNFPIFVARCRHLSFDSNLLDKHNIFAHESGHAATRAITQDQDTQSSSKDQVFKRDEEYLHHHTGAHECMACHAMLPTHHLLDIHITEMHDSFFKAQASRKMPVYICLVESCSEKFSSGDDRKQHLILHHRFPKTYNFDRIHLRKRKGKMKTVIKKEDGAQGQQSRDKTDVEMMHDPPEDLIEGFSRLKMAAHTSAVPPVIGFGKRRGGIIMMPPGK